MKRPKTRAPARSIKSARGRTARKTAAAVGKAIVERLTETHFLPHVSDEDSKRVMGTDSAVRKRYPLTSGLLDYFPDACLEVSSVSYAGNQKHNPGEFMHHARGKSMDHADCIARHLTERGGYDEFVVDGVTYRVRHTAALAWRALALLQEELELTGAATLPRGARLP